MGKILFFAKKINLCYFCKTNQRPQLSQPKQNPTITFHKLSPVLFLGITRKEKCMYIRVTCIENTHTQTERGTLQYMAKHKISINQTQYTPAS